MTPTSVTVGSGSGVVDASGGRIAAMYHGAVAERDKQLVRARRCAELTLPTYLPHEGRDAGGSLTQNYQSLGADGISNLQGRLLTAILPIGVPWVTYDMAPEIRYSKSISEERKRAIADELYVREMIVQAAVESIRGRGARQPATLRSIKRTVYGHILITGEALEFLGDEGDDFQLRTYRRDTYVTLRDAEGNVLNHIIWEQVDPLALGDEKLKRSKLRVADLRKKYTAERMLGLWTLVEWQPESKVWKIEQELNGNAIATRQERVTPFFSTPYDLVPPDHYGIGLAEQKLGDLSSFDELSERELDFAALASKIHPVIDASSEVRAQDFKKKSGEVIEGARVQAGEAQDIGWFGAGKLLPNFEMVRVAKVAIEQRLGRAMLLGSQSVRDSERTTATEVVRVTIQELEGAMGGVYSSIADEQQMPMHDRVVAVLEAKARLPRLPAELVRITANTGIAALNREASAQRLLRMFEIIKGLPQELSALLVRRIDDGTLLQRLARDAGVEEPGLVKTSRQLEAETQKAAALQAQLAAAGKAIDTGGNIIENAAAQAQAT